MATRGFRRSYAATPHRNAASSPALVLQTPDKTLSWPPETPLFLTDIVERRVRFHLNPKVQVAPSAQSSEAAVRQAASRSVSKKSA